MPSELLGIEEGKIICVVRTMFTLRSMFNISIAHPILKYTNYQGKEKVLKEDIIHKIS